MGQTKSKTNHTGNKSVPWFNDSKIGLTKDRSDVMLSITRKGEIPKPVELYELFVDSATWVKELLIHVKDIDNNTVGPIQKELLEAQKIVKSRGGQIYELEKEVRNLTTVKETISGDLAVARQKGKKLLNTIRMWRRISVTLAVSTFLTVSYVILTMNTEGLVKLI